MFGFNRVARLANVPAKIRSAIIVARPHKPFIVASNSYRQKTCNKNQNNPNTTNFQIKIFENIGDKYNFNFVYHSTIETDSNFWFSVPALFDVDADSDLDIILGNIYGNLRLYKQDTPFSFSFELDNFQDISIGYYSAPYFFDIDLDDDLDLVVGGRDTHKTFLNDNGIFNENDSFGIPYLGKNVKFFGGNLFSSNEYNLISGISTGGIYLLSEDLCIHGDLNQDQLVNISDILILIDLIIESQTRNAYLKCAGDLNNDFGFNILDIAVLVHLILN